MNTPSFWKLLPLPFHTNAFLSLAVALGSRTLWGPPLVVWSPSLPSPRWSQPYPSTITWPETNGWWHWYLQLPVWYFHVPQACQRYPKQNLEPQFALKKGILSPYLLNKLVFFLAHANLLHMKEKAISNKQNTNTSSPSVCINGVLTPSFLTTSHWSPSLVDSISQDVSGIFLFYPFLFLLQGICELR